MHLAVERRGAKPRFAGYSVVGEHEFDSPTWASRVVLFEKNLGIPAGS
jgi:hypothetical protein